MTTDFEAIYVLNNGYVELIDIMGSDLSIVNAAKVSFSSELTEMDPSAVGLINFLMKNKHATPFEHALFKFRVKCPIFVAREWFRHRWSSFNEMSMRYYIPEKIDFFYPEKESVRKQVGKPGAYHFEPMDHQEIAYSELMFQFERVYRAAEDAYQSLINIGVAKELARSVLPVGQYTEFIWTVNARSLINFLSLRNDSNAQFEINEYAKIIEDKFFAESLPVTYKAFIESGREAI